MVATPLEIPIRVLDALARPLDLDLMERLLHAAGDPVRPLLVGHDPDFSFIAAELLGIGELPMRKGTLARIDIERPLRAGMGRLIWFVPPDLLAIRDRPD
jgi:phosphohistidine phosphatase SixA